jgi:hypothetical protein
MKYRSLVHAAPAARVRPRVVLTLALLALGGRGATAEVLPIPATIGGYPTNVGLLVLGHSTSAQGGYPAKLEAALRANALGEDGRHYQVVRAITAGDGGFLWSRLAVPPGDPAYERVRASSGVGASPSPQWCEDAAGTRWSCRRAKLDEVLSGSFPIPATGSCADPGVAVGCRAPATIVCTWYDRTQPLGANPVTAQLSPHDCLARMDYRLALVQDTTNRSWPVDDFDANGAVDGDDLWPASRVRPEALPCGAGSGVVDGFVDWNCDGALDWEDAPHEVYADWLETLAQALLAAPGTVGADWVLFGHKPLEMGQCSLYPEAERPACLADPHAVRSPAAIAATPDRPFDHFYVPTVYWEQAGLAALFARPGLDARIRHRDGGDGLALWRRSEACYTTGLVPSDWRIPAAVPGRPGTVAADDTEVDGGPTADANGVGCMVTDHIHHNEIGGWMMADAWYAGLARQLLAVLFDDGFEGGSASPWSERP